MRFRVKFWPYSFGFAPGFPKSSPARQRSDLPLPFGRRTQPKPQRAKTVGPKVILVVNFSTQPPRFSSPLFATTFASLSLSLALVGAAHAQPTLPNLPPAPAAPTPATSSAASSASLERVALAAPTDPDALSINIDGRNVFSDPPPLLRSGRTFVPLRGVLENLGAKVDYIPSERRVNIVRGVQNVQLFLGTTRATIDGREVEVEKPLLIDGRAFVPLRAVSELFGLKVSWLAPTRTVAIYTGAPVAKPLDKRGELKAAGPFGLTIDFTQYPIEQMPNLLDSAKAAGVGLIKFRFDWGTLEPTKGSAYNWAYFDTILREARARNLRVVGILGDTAPWASVTTSTFGGDQRQSPPRVDAYNSWANYVRRTVGRYGNDVLAWQVWENPNSTNFRSVDRIYRTLARAAIDQARLASPDVIIYAADPGGVDLDSIRGYNDNGLTSASDGIVIYPDALYQALSPAPAEAFLQPYARVISALKLPDSKTRDYWIGGVSRPVALPFPDARPNAEGQRALEIFTPVAQADYLVKTMTLGLAAGSDKVFYDALRDAPDARMNAALQAAPADADAPSNPASTGAMVAAKVTAPKEGVVQDSGLQRADGTPRPGFAALRSLTTNLTDKPYKGYLSFDSKLVALVFANGSSSVLVAWSPQGDATLALNSSGAAVDLPGAQFVETRPDSVITDASGDFVGQPDGVLKLSTRPIIITNIGAKNVQAALVNPPGGPLRLQDARPYENVQTVSAELAPNGAENGIFWRKYGSFGSVAEVFVEREGRQGLTTQPQYNIFDLKSQKPFVYLDVADEFLYDAPGVPVTLSIEVYAPQLADPTKALGFRVEYNSSKGNSSVPWQPLVPGSGWQTFQIALPDAQFANAGGYDILFNVGASAAGVTFGNVSLARGLPGTAPQANTALGTATGVALGTPTIAAPGAAQ